MSEIEQKLQEGLNDIIKKYLDTNVTKPTIDTIKKDIFVLHKLGSLLISLRLASELILEKGIEFDKTYLDQLPKHEREERLYVYKKYSNNESNDNEEIIEQARKFLKADSSNKHLIPYLLRELNWVTISILSASYISAHVLLRSSFELLIGIATKVNGKMGERIENIKFLSIDEQKTIKKLWRKLCGWGHPYQKWEKEICPIFLSHEPIYHPKLCKECLEKLETMIGFFLVVTIEKFEISKKELMEKIEIFPVNLSEIPLLNSRI